VNKNILLNVREFATFQDYAAESDFGREIRGEERLIGLKDEVENVRRSGCEAIGVAATDHPASGLHCHFSLIVEEEYNRAGGLYFTLEIIFQCEGDKRLLARERNWNTLTES